MILGGMEPRVAQGNAILFFEIIVMIKHDVHKDRWDDVWYNRGLLDSVRDPVVLIFMVAA